jgi:DMSO/TMAO reductase YedYZ molybdopterin-dependent catalytic subunit
VEKNENGAIENRAVESSEIANRAVDNGTVEKPPVRLSRRWFLVLGAGLVAGVTGLSRFVAACAGAASGGATPSAVGSTASRVPDFSGRFPVLNIEGEVPTERPEQWVVEVTGLVEQPLKIDHQRWTALPRVSYTKTFHCVEGWSVDNIDWGGVRVSEVLSLAKPRPEGKFVNFIAYGEDYTDDLTMAEALGADTLLADTLEGAPLSPEHGGPVRLVIPSQLGYKNVKWVARLDVTAERHKGYWEQRGYSVEAPVG